MEMEKSSYNRTLTVTLLRKDGIKLNQLAWTPVECLALRVYKDFKVAVVHLNAMQDQREGDRETGQCDKYGNNNGG